MTAGAKPADWHRQAITVACDGDNARALDLLRREILFNPANRAATCDAFTIGTRIGSPKASRLAAWSVRLHPLFAPGWRHLLSTLTPETSATWRRAIARHAALLTVGNGPDTRRVGEAFMGLADFTHAAKALSWAAIIVPGDVSIWFALAQSRFQTRDHRAASIALDNARDTGLPRDQDLFWRARLLLAMRRYEEADAIISEANRAGGELAARCRVLRHTARVSDFRAPASPPSR